MSGTFWRTCPEIFANPEERLKTTGKAKVSYETNEKDTESAFILVIMAPLMTRVHQKVYVVKVKRTSVVTFYQKTVKIFFWKLNVTVYHIREYCFEYYYGKSTTMKYSYV